MKTLIKFQLISILTLATVVLAWAHDIGLLQQKPLSRTPNVVIAKHVPRTSNANLSLLNFGAMAWSRNTHNQNRDTEKMPSNLSDIDLQRELMSANPADRSAALSRLVWLNHIAAQSLDGYPKSVSTRQAKNL